MEPNIALGVATVVAMGFGVWSIVFRRGNGKHPPEPAAQLAPTPPVIVDLAPLADELRRIAPAPPLDISPLLDELRRIKSSAPVEPYSPQLHQDLAHLAERIEAAAQPQVVLPPP